MSHWQYIVYAEASLTTVCYIASVRAETESKSLSILQKELSRVPMPLYVGPLMGGFELQSVPQEGNLQRTVDSDVRLTQIQR